MGQNNLSELIRHGNKQAIMEGLLSTGAFYRMQAILGIVNHRIMNDAIKTQLLKLKADDENVLGYKISDFAKGALHKFGIEEYIGDDPGILSLILADTWFEEQ